MKPGTTAIWFRTKRGGRGCTRIPVIVRGKTARRIKVEYVDQDGGTRTRFVLPEQLEAFRGNSSKGA